MKNITNPTNSLFNTKFDDNDKEGWSIAWVNALTYKVEATASGEPEANYLWGLQIVFKNDFRVPDQLLEAYPQSQAG